MVFGLVVCNWLTAPVDRPEAFAGPPVRSANHKPQTYKSSIVAISLSIATAA